MIACFKIPSYTDWTKQLKWQVDSVDNWLELRFDYVSTVEVDQWFILLFAGRDSS